MTPGRPTSRHEIHRYLALRAAELEAAALYRELARATTGRQREILTELAEVESRHAAHWEAKLRAAGGQVPLDRPHRPGMRTRLLGWLARRFGVSAVLPLVERAERADAGRYDNEPEATPGMARDERSHARTLAHLRLQQGGPAIARRERWHRGDKSGGLRAAVFGINDGLVSNTALVMGFAGSQAASHTIMFAGLAGLLAGSFSMAAGEFISMSSQREMFAREINLEAQEIREMPEEEEEELVLIYQAKGLAADDARELARRIMKDEDAALDTMVREELGLDPEQLGSPWTAALSSLIAFAVGAFVVVLPYILASGTAAFIAAIAAAAGTLFAVGAALGFANGRAPLWSGLRQLLVGVLAAGVTFGVGRLIGVSVS